MFEKLRIKPHMEIVGADGSHVGTVEEMVGDAIKLTLEDTGDGRRRFVPFDSVERIADHRIHLKAGADAPQPWDWEPQAAPGETPPLFGTSQEHIDPNEYSSSRPGSAHPSSPLFGTSGHGTGMGGSGVGH